MSLKRILKLLAAFFTGQGVSIVTQLLVPPFFLHRYAPVWRFTVSGLH